VPAADWTRARARGGAGHTLVELAVVIAILGLLSAEVAPRFFTQSVFQQRGYADELAGALRAAQKAAVITGCHARLTLAAGSYAVAQQAPLGNTCNPADASWSTPLLAPDGSTVADAAPAGTTAAPAGAFEFDGQGRLVTSPGTTITVGTHSITIDSNTGYIQVQ
jgi:MSHA pilin protein MshC